MTSGFVADSPLVTMVCPAVNFGERVPDGRIDFLILHYTGMQSARAALDWLVCRESQVSCHYFVHEDGRIDQLVPEIHRAWHAGQSFWRGETDINSRSIGIEVANGGHDYGLPDFPSVQIGALIELCRDCVQRHAIRPQNVLAHSDIAPRRKRDPGEKFPWKTLFDHGIGHWVAPCDVVPGGYLQRGEQGEPVEALQSMLALYGYSIEMNGLFDENTEFVVKAFQRRFRPALVDGVADHSTVSTLHSLLGSRISG